MQNFWILVRYKNFRRRRTKIERDQGSKTTNQSWHTTRNILGIYLVSINSLHVISQQSATKSKNLEQKET